MLNYFELYGMPETFHPDAAAVKKKYFELSRLHHPDRATLGSNDAQAEALKMSALNNAAYKTLSNEDATMKYLLQRHNLLEEEEKYALPPDFLMEMMELNEAVDEATGGEIKLAKAALEEHLENWKRDVKPLLLQFEKGNRSEALLLQVKDYYFRKKYLLRIAARML